MLSLKLNIKNNIFILSLSWTTVSDKHQTHLLYRYTLLLLLLYITEQFNI